MIQIFSDKMDKIDISIPQLLVLNHNNKQISTRPKVPLSAIQRRKRKLIEKGLSFFTL
jgi:hypothetical protein